MDNRDTEHQQVVTQLVEQISKPHRVVRGCLAKPLAGIYLEIVQAVRCELQQQLDMSPHLTPHLWDQAYRAILTRDRLQQLAIATQQYELRTAEFQSAIDALIRAIQASDKLRLSGQWSTETHAEAINQTLLWVCENIHHYDSTKGEFMSWMNYRLGKIATQVSQQQKDPFIASAQARVLRAKYQLNSIVKRLKLEDLCCWLKLDLKGCGLLANLSAVWGVAIVYAQTPTIGEELTYKLAQSQYPEAAQVTQVDDPQFLENLEQPGSEDNLGLVEQVRQYVQTDPQGVCRERRMRSHPQVTFQRLLLERTADPPQTWEQLSTVYGAKISALSAFYQRALVDIAPQIAQALQT
jgi:hypothetical protein